MLRTCLQELSSAYRCAAVPKPEGGHVTPWWLDVIINGCRIRFGETTCKKVTCNRQKYISSDFNFNFLFHKTSLKSNFFPQHLEVIRQPHLWATGSPPQMQMAQQLLQNFLNDLVQNPPLPALTARASFAGKFYGPEYLSFSVGITTNAYNSRREVRRQRFWLSVILIYSTNSNSKPFCKHYYNIARSISFRPGGERILPRLPPAAVAPEGWAYGELVRTATAGWYPPDYAVV